MVRVSKLVDTPIRFTCFVCYRKKVVWVNVGEDPKSYSSKWVKKQGIGLKNFYWQRGYGAFSVDLSEVETFRQKDN